MNNKDIFCKTLLDTGRKGIEATISNLEKLGFFDAPASSKYHLSVKGGLLQHSINVYNQAMYQYKIQTHIRPDLKDIITTDNIAIAALLHDVCKADIYKQVEKWKKDDENNKWEKKLVYEVEQQELPIGHGEKSVVRLLRFGLDLQDCEIAAIRWHMGSFDLSDYPDSKICFNKATEECPLVSIIMVSDYLATKIMETK